MDKQAVQVLSYNIIMSHLMYEMWPIAIDDLVAWYVCLCLCGCAKTTEQIEVLFGMETARLRHVA